MEIRRNGKQSAPLGVVRMVTSGSSKRVGAEAVGIHAYNEIYAAIGVQPQDFERWESAHGMYSSGIDATGEMLAPGYPIFSRVASMYIDPVTLTSAETTALVQECQQAIRKSASESAKQELEAISALAQKALSSSAVVQFGHP